MRRCDHDKIYSGQIKLGNRFSCICRKCGEQWDDATYDIGLVDLEQYHALRVAHGWAGPSRFPAPPRVPRISTPPAREQDGRFLMPTLLFSALFMVCGLAGVPFLAPWGIWETILPRWLAMVSSGAALATATLCYVCWRKGSDG